MLLDHKLLVLIASSHTLFTIFTVKYDLVKRVWFVPLVSLKIVTFCNEL